MARRAKRPQSKRSGRANQKDLYGYLIISSVLLLLSIVGLGAWWLRPVSLDKQTNCPSTGPIAYVSFLLDLTDPLTENQVQALRNHFTRVRDKVVPTHGALELYAVEGNGEKALSHKILKCKPENPNDEKDTAGVGLVKSGKRMQQRWVADYQSVFDKALDDAASRSRAEVSPLLESVQSVTVQSFNVSGREESQKVLVFVSDLMQNSPNISFYSDIPTLEELAGSAAYKKVSADLNGVVVIIYQISRPELSASEAVMKLWVALFESQGADVLVCDDLMRFRDFDDEQGCKFAGVTDNE